MQSSASATPGAHQLGGNKGEFGLELTTPKFNKALRSLDEQLTPSAPQQMGLGDIASQLNQPQQLGIGAALPASTGPDEFAKVAAAGYPEDAAKAGGFDVDQALQYAALASQLGSMFAGPPPPRPPSVGGGGGGISLRSVYGGR